MELVKKKISEVLSKNSTVLEKTVDDMLKNIPENSLPGKLYEAWILATVCENLVVKERLTVKYIGGSRLSLKMKGGPVNRSYPYFEVYRSGELIGELFTDIYFNTISHSMRAGQAFNSIKGDYHELDIALLQPGIIGLPDFSEVLIAIECKNASIKKSIIREVLGFRRELSYVSETLIDTLFNFWPAARVHSNPSSVQMLYSTDVNVRDYEDNCINFGIIVDYLGLPGNRR